MLDVLRKEDLSEGRMCCVCGHSLLGHIAEPGGWRCHSTATQDSLQCECFLRKEQCDGEGIDFYSLSRRRELTKKTLVRR